MSEQLVSMVITSASIGAMSDRMPLNLAQQQAFADGGFVDLHAANAGVLG